MKIVVIGGSGLIGTKVVDILRRQGHDVLAGSRATGVNALTGEGLAAAMAGTQVVVDVSNSPSFEDGPVMEFFEMGSRNLLAAERAAGVGHHVALSVVGTERMQASGSSALILIRLPPLGGEGWGGGTAAGHSLSPLAHAESVRSPTESPHPTGDSRSA